MAAEEVGWTSSRIELPQLQTAKPKKASIDRTHVFWALENALQNFQLELDEYQCQELRGIQAVPDPDAVLVLTAHLDSRSRDRKGQAVSSRLFPVLQSAQEFCEIAGISHGKLPLLVWGSVKMTALVSNDSPPLGRPAPVLKNNDQTNPLRLSFNIQCLIMLSRKYS